MASRSLGLRSHVNYLVYRVRNLNAGSVVERAREVSRQFGKPVATVVADMYWQAAVHKVGFQDYVDYDFAMLTRAERKTFMTHPISNAISQKYDHPDYRHLFHDKFAFVREFSDLLGRDWMMLDAGNADELAAFMATHPTIITKRQTGQAGSAITRYTIDDVDDAAAFHRGLLERGELLIEENIVQHPDLAAVCPGTVNSTRIAAFFDGEKTHILAMAQKFGRGQAADQMDFGGFYTMLDEHGKAMGDGYDSHGHVWERHPDTGFPIAEFRLPMLEEALDLIDRAARVVPQVQYVGWDGAITEKGPVLIEGNWGTGVYEIKPSVLGRRTGHRPRYREVIGF